MAPSTTTNNERLLTLQSAIADYELADARLEWARICHCDLVPEQRGALAEQLEAIEWHIRERRRAHEALLALGWKPSPPSAAA